VERLKLQRKTNSDHEQQNTFNSSLIEQATNSASGQALDPQVRATLEPQFGHSFADVRVFSDAQADRMARDVNATAFTVGQDMFFRDGEYNPESLQGRHLLAHELTHTIQQRGAKHDGKALEISQASDASEIEADVASNNVITGQVAQVNTAATVSVAREAEHHHKAGWIDRLFGLNPDRSFVEAGLDPLFGQDGVFKPREGDGTGTILAKALGSAASVPYVAGAAIGGHVLDEINHGPLMLHGAFDKEKDE
jgi:Domain of unknown function (DUF4157)